MNRDTVRELTKLYADLAALDDWLKSMLSRDRDRCIHKISFYHQTPCVSGPQDYTPKYMRAAIAENVITDMKTERRLLVEKIHRFGFETPGEPIAN